MGVRSGPRSPAEPTPALAGLPALLADGGTGALPAVLGRVVVELGLRSLVLRDAGPGGELIAVAGEVVQAVPGPRGRTRRDLAGVLELPVVAAGRPLAVLTAVGARPSTAAALREVVALVALTLSASRRTPAAGALDVLDAADEEVDAVADALHDGPVQALVAARWIADAAVRGEDPRHVRDALQDALVVLRRSLWQLRPRGAAGLAAALASLSDRLVDNGGAPLDVELDQRVAGDLSPQAASLAYRLVQAVAVPEEAPAVRVRLRLQGGTAALEVTGGAPLPPGQRWAARARALGADLHVAAGDVRLLLPVHPAATPIPAGTAPAPPPDVRVAAAGGPAPKATS